MAVEFAEHERPDAERIAGSDQHRVGEGDEGVGAFERAQGLDEALDDARPAARAIRCRMTSVSEVD